MAGLSNAIHTINNLVVNLCHLLAMLVIAIGIGKALIIYLKNILIDEDELSRFFSGIKEPLSIGKNQQTDNNRNHNQFHVYSYR